MTVALDEDLVSKMKKKKDIEMLREDLSNKFNILRLRIEEMEAREA